MLQAASAKLRYPAITFILSDTRKCKIYLATKGYVAIKIDGEYTGKIPEPGQPLVLYHQDRAIWSEIREFCIAPAASAVVKGRKYGACCFCGRTLDNASSVYHGYGPICADNFGLPWGDLPQAEPIELVDL